MDGLYEFMIVGLIATVICLVAVFGLSGWALIVVAKALFRL